MLRDFYHSSGYVGVLVKQWPSGLFQFIGAKHGVRVEFGTKDFVEADLLDVDEHTKETLLEVLKDYIFQQQDLYERF